MKAITYLLNRKKVLNRANDYSVKIRKHSECVHIERGLGSARISLGFWQMHTTDEDFIRYIDYKYRNPEIGKEFTANDSRTRKHFALLLACYDLRLNYENFLKLENKIEL